MKMVMSLWTSPGRFGMTRAEITLATLAVNAAKEHFDESHFVTDKKGREIAELLGWEFDKTTTELERLHIQGNPNVWASGKLLACYIQRAPFIHIDLDVILHKRPSGRVLDSCAFAQSPDKPDHYTKNGCAHAIRELGLPDGITAYNCGIVGGRNTSFLQDWAKAGLESASEIDDAIDGTSASMVVEQYMLGCCSESLCVPITPLFDSKPTDAQAEAAGYSHFVGASKRAADVYARAKRRIAQMFPDSLKQMNTGMAEAVELCKHSA